MKVVGFYPLIATFPSPAVPLLRSTSGTQYHFQVVGKDQRIERFAPAANVVPARIVVDALSDHIEADVGDQAVFAVAISKKRVLTGTTESLQHSLKAFVANSGTQLQPFNLLEFALFIQDADLIETAALACKSRLEMVAPEIVGRWIEGAPLSENAKARLRTTTSVSPSSREPTREYLRIGFSGPHNFMRALTTYAENVATTRAAIIRELFEADDSGSIFDASLTLDRGLSLILDGLFKKGAYTPDAWHISRGAIYAFLEDADAFYSKRGAFLKALRESQSYRLYRSAPFYNGGMEHLHFLMIFCYFLLKYPQFQGHLDRSVN